MTGRKGSIFVLFATVSIVLIAVGSGFTQATTGTLRGVIEDPNGHIVAGAAVVAKNEATGFVSARIITAGDGSFTITNLIPGTYAVTVSAGNFKTQTIENVAVRLGNDTELKITLNVGPMNETVTVVSNANEIAQTNSEISTNLERRRVQELPSNAVGSGLDTLALNAPGVTPGFGNTTVNGTSLSVNGNRSRSNNFTVDGTDNNDLMFTGPSLHVSNPEVVQEYQIITNNFSALYGRNLGSIVNIVTKSGTNDFSGSAFGYHRNSSDLDAMNNIERRTEGRSKRDKFISNVFGGTFGGPIVRRRAFFFVGYQGVRQSQNTTFRSDNPAILSNEFPRLRALYPGNAAIETIISQGAFGLRGSGVVRPRRDRSATSVCISPQASDCPGGSANNPATTFAAAFPEFEFQMPFERNEILIRGDWNISSGANVSARYLGQGSDTKNWLASNNGFTGDLSARSRNVSAFYVQQLTPRSANNLQATYQRIAVIYGGGCGDPIDGCIPDPSSIGEAFTTIAFGGISSASGATLQGIGGARSFPQGRIVGVFQLADKIAWTVGSHAVVAGFDFRYLRNRLIFLPDINGFVRFNSRAALANNNPTSITLADGPVELVYPQYDQFYFFQDDWRISSGLTLNLGVRYEYSGQPINRIARLTHDRETDPAKAFYRQDLAIESRTAPFIPSDKNNIAPRVGLAWSPSFGKSRLARLIFGRKDSTVLRGGFAVAYDAVFYNFVSNVATSAPAVFLDTFTPSVGLPANATGTAMRSVYSANLRRNALDPRLLSQTDVSGDFHSPYSIQYSIGVQRQINESNVLEVRYVGNRGKGLIQTVNGNPFYGNLYNGFSQSITLGGAAQVINFPSFRNLLGNVPTPQVCVDVTGTADNEGACNGRLLAGRGLIRSRRNTGNSQYDSLQARYNGRLLEKSLTLGATYTWSKAMDNASEIFPFGESSMAQNPFDLRDGEWSISGFDRPHSFSLNFIYDVPGHRGQKGFAGKLLGGWQINGIYNLASGRPFTPEQFRNSQAFSNSYLDAGFANTFIGLDNLRPFNGNPTADPRLVAITSIDARLSGLMSATAAVSPTGFYLLNDLNRGVLTPVTPNDVRFVFNGPGAALFFGTPFGTATRNSVRGKTLNQLNFGVFKTTRISEKFSVQFRAEAFNVLNVPNSGFGVAAGASLPVLTVESAGIVGAAFADNGDVALGSRRVQFGLRFLF